MRCPSIAELPPPPSDKTGWPWTEASPPLEAIMPDGRPWPKVSIVTPSYNQGAFLEETIRSVLLQGHPNLEYIVMDGGSTDQSVEILRKYEPWLGYWVSEPDWGQSDAINRGFARATGEIFGWLNSDDTYERGSLSYITRYFASRPECDLVYGKGWYLDASGKKTYPCHWVRPFDRKLLLTFNFILQPAAFWRRLLWERTGGLDISYHWAMDWDWFIRATALVEPHYLPVDLARWRITAETKTMAGGQARRAEVAGISRRYGGVWQPTYIIYLLDHLARCVSNRPAPRPIGRMLQYLLIATRWTLQKTVWRGRCLF